MTHLRKMMLEELQRRNYAQTTIETYVRAVREFSQYFNCSPDRLGPRHIREYQAALFQKRKFSPNTVGQHLAALRFFYIKTLKKAWSITETPYPKRAEHLPTILGQEEVAQLIDAALTPYHRTLLMTLYATGVRRAELTHLKVSDIDSKRMVIHVQGGKGRKDRDILLSPKLLDELKRHWRRLCGESPAYGCFQATAGIPVIPRSTPRWCGTLAKKPPNERASRKTCTHIRCGTASLRICSKQARICAPSRGC